MFLPKCFTAACWHPIQKLQSLTSLFYKSIHHIVFSLNKQQDIHLRNVLLFIVIIDKHFAAYAALRRQFPVCVALHGQTVSGRNRSSNYGIDRPSMSSHACSPRSKAFSMHILYTLRVGFCYPAGSAVSTLLLLALQKSYPADSPISKYPAHKNHRDKRRRLLRQQNTHRNCRLLHRFPQAAPWQDVHNHQRAARWCSCRFSSHDTIHQTRRKETRHSLSGSRTILSDRVLPPTGPGKE